MRGLSLLRSLSAFSGSSLGTCLESATRGLSTGSDLKTALKEKIPEQQERLKALKKGYGKKELGTVTLDMAIGGMRGIPVSGTSLAH
ncbi:hypothetical protein ABBQ32_006424 [Trebouxia sp. C0010 RCD-2024]